MPVLFPGRIGIVGVFGGRKNGERREKALEQGKNQQQTKPTYCAGCSALLPLIYFIKS